MRWERAKAKMDPAEVVSYEFESDVGSEEMDKCLVEVGIQTEVLLQGFQQFVLTLMKLQIDFPYNGSGI